MWTVEGGTPPCRRMTVRPNVLQHGADDVRHAPASSGVLNVYVMAWTRSIFRLLFPGPRLVGLPHTPACLAEHRCGSARTPPWTPRTRSPPARREHSPPDLRYPATNDTTQSHVLPQIIPVRHFPVLQNTCHPPALPHVQQRRPPCNTTRASSHRTSVCSCPPQAPHIDHATLTMPHSGRFRAMSV